MFRGSKEPLFHELCNFGSGAGLWACLEALSTPVIPSEADSFACERISSRGTCFFGSDTLV